MALLTHWSFGISMVFVAALYVVVHTVPRALVRLNSVPWAFHLRRAHDLRYQAVLYRAFHTRRWARVSHLTLLWEQPLWFALLWLVHPVAFGLALCALLTLASNLRPRWLVVAFALTWSVSAVLGWGLVVALGGGVALVLAEALLLGGAALRLIGHVGEPIPPGLADPLRFVPIGQARRRLHMVAVTFVGAISELAASLPFRLILVEVLWLAERIGFVSARFGTKTEHDADAIRVHQEGWAGCSVTAWMCPASSVDDPNAGSRDSRREADEADARGPCNRMIEPRTVAG